MSKFMQEVWVILVVFSFVPFFGNFQGNDDQCSEQALTSNLVDFACVLLFLMVNYLYFSICRLWLYLDGDCCVYRKNFQFVLGK